MRKMAEMFKMDCGNVYKAGGSKSGHVQGFQNLLGQMLTKQAKASDR